ncbi:lysozyme [Bifidobacterium tissieri]|uniref:Lysozyme n=1 Tax=Bifidobacterium tissieri TaxID=1630162 RepID=A0A5M9ZVU2_9BIFI|nr:lysozyme [Bifidobacterium tissieri]KAA8829322.1 lysozyme [Bifidobacterium tissieri]KAA8831635.1 lysozyme [Bifidobacterium tissieri]
MRFGKFVGVALAVASLFGVGVAAPSASAMDSASVVSEDTHVAVSVADVVSAHHMVSLNPIGELRAEPEPVDVDTLAQAVLRGEYGDGDERRTRLGRDYAAVQERVNELMPKVVEAPKTVEVSAAPQQRRQSAKPQPKRQAAPKQQMSTPKPSAPQQQKSDVDVLADTMAKADQCTFEDGSGQESCVWHGNNSAGNRVDIYYGTDGNAYKLTDGQGLEVSPRNPE